LLIGYLNQYFQTQTNFFPLINTYKTYPSFGNASCTEMKGIARLRQTFKTHSAPQNELKTWRTKIIKRIAVFFCRLTQTENGIHRTGWNCSPSLLSFLPCVVMWGGGVQPLCCEHQSKHRDCGGVLRLFSTEAEQVWRTNYWNKLVKDSAWTESG